jgi:hypothetical protein
MLKTALLLLNVTGYLLFNILFADGVVIEDNTPTEMTPGSKTKVEINVNKGNVTGFAKLQLELPDGLIATPAETNGASFTFSGQKAKFIWMSLPSDQEFTVAYFLEASPSAKGNYVVKGTFSYIKENQRVDYEMQSKVVVVSTNAVAADNNTNTTQTGGTNTASINAQNNTATQAIGLRCVREITQVNAQEYMVSLLVKDSDLEGFAKIQEVIPSGYIIQEEDSDGAVVTTSDDGVKFVWFEVPQMNEFGVTYRLVSESSSDAPVVNGTFSYVLNNQPKEVAVLNLGTTELVVDNPTPPVDTSTGNTTTGNTTTGNTTTGNTTTGNTTTGNTTTGNTGNTGNTDITTPPDNAVADTTPVTPKEIEKKEAPKSTSIPNPDTGVSYKVQIAASHSVVTQSYFVKKHSFKKNVNIENHEGWVKYTTGSFDMYKGARDERELIRNAHSFRGPFVTAYNDGERITVQEALMISKQKWYK